jgi:hypothetical protein
VTGLFSQLGKLAASGGQAENQLSRTFAAAFNASQAVREATLPLFTGAFRGVRRRSAAHWVCLTEVRTRRGDGRLDLVLVPNSRTDPHGPRAIVLENKLGSPLTKRQLRKYRKVYGRVGVITKAYPTVSAQWLRGQRLPAFRWHQVHAALLAAATRRSGESWLVRELTIYLEDLGMASRGLTWKDALAIQRTLGLVGGEVSRHGVTTLALERLAVAFAFVEDVAAAVRDTLSDSAKIRMWGPGYYKEDYADGDGVCHQFGFTLSKRSGGKHANWVDYYLSFPQSTVRAPCAWAGVFVDDGGDDFSDSRKWNRARLTSRRGEFREEAHIADVVRTLRSWKRYIT